MNIGAGLSIPDFLTESSHKAARRYPIFKWIAPAIFFLLSVVTTLAAGGRMSGEEYLSISGLYKGFPFALATIFLMGSHAFGHYLAARFHGVDAYLPYFVPSFGFDGTAGAYTKMKWPISDRNSLIGIFSIGPIAGFLASWLMFAIGLSMSQIIETTVGQFSLGDSLITYLTSQLVIGHVPKDQDVLLHPVAYAGWMGLYYNCWHLLPIGKLDGGRILYALRGHKVTRRVSYCTIVFLVILGFILSRWWIAMALFGALCMIEFRAQYPADNYTDEIRNGQWSLSFMAAIILIISLPVI